jgi:hypothetical protein
MPDSYLCRISALIRVKGKDKKREKKEKARER